MNKEYTIVCFGDSTTDDSFIPNEEYLPYYKDQKVYSHWLQEKLPGILDRKVKVINSGVSGDTTWDAKLRFKKDVLDHNPDLVIIQLGVNDQGRQLILPLGFVEWLLVLAPPAQPVWRSVLARLTPPTSAGS